MKNKRGKPPGPPQTPAAPSAPAAIDRLLNQAFAQHAAGRLAEAEALCRQILGASPNHAVALHLLGVIAYQAGQNPLALELIDAALQANPQSAEAWTHRGAVLHALRQYPEALASYDRAIALNPSYADAHNNRGNTLHSLRRYQEALAACDRAIALRPDYPDAWNNRGNALLALDQHQAAVESYDRAIALNPNYADAYTNRGNALQSLNLANPNPSKHASSGRDLVFYCGPVTETWNPDTVKATGIGGSEEAVLWLSRLFHHRGWNVTVYANCGLEEKNYEGVSWKPYWLWNYRDKQNVTILWRYPRLADYDINSDRIILDLHDVIPESEFTASRLQRIHRIFVKSRFHRSLYPAIPDDKFSIVPNGIDAQLFDTAATARDPHLLINTSSADRSLETFLDCFEQIKLQVPHAKAEWAYGWGVWDAVRASNLSLMQWKAAMQVRMRQLGVAERGRISYTEVARLYLRANIFAYPSEMAEIDCISLSKAMAAGAIPVTTDFAAMGEKSGHGGIFIPSTKTKDNWIQPGQFQVDMTDPEQKAQFVAAAVDLLRNPPAESARDSMRQWARSTFDWNTVADAWHGALTGPQANAALASYDHAIRLNPNHAEAHHNRGCAFHAQLAYGAAIECYDEALRLKPDYANAHANRGNALLALKQYSAALASFDRALALQPDYEYLRGTRLHTRRLLCDWHDDAADLAQLEAAIARGERVALPFATLALTASPALQKRAAEIYVADKHPPRPESEAAPILPHLAHSRIRIGYFSADFYNHATSYLMAELFERHDRTRFEILGFSFGPDTGDPMRSRVSAAMDRFLDVRSLTDRDIAQLSRSLQVDIAVDLKGFTRDHRAGIFAHRAAPIQASYVGYPGTMGAPWMDYLIADPTLIPARSRHHYSEKIAYLPGTYQPNDARRPIAATTPTRAAEGLPETAFVFCCFNNTYKITPAVFALWMRILARVEGSVLWLLEDNPASIANLRAEAARCGISPARLIFARPQPIAEHLARHALAGLFLDTTPYNAHTTASDALWTGLPILTLPNETFAGRVAASLLRATSLPEPALTGLIATSESEYEQRAVALAQHPERLLSLRTHLRQSRATAPLFDTAAFTRQLEAAYTAMLQGRPVFP